MPLAAGRIRARSSVSMKRRHLLLSLASAAPCLGSRRLAGSPGEDYENPYEEVDWDRWETIHSMSHQHQGTSEASRELFLAMGYRHFAFSNYYPSAPTPLPDAFREAHPEISWAPNAEQHSFLDSGLHCNSLGSRLATGYGSSLSSAQRKHSPLEHRFTGLRAFHEKRPWEGVYRLDLRLESAGESERKEALATLTIAGASACSRRDAFADEGPIEGRSLESGNHAIYLRVHSGEVGITLKYAPSDLVVTQCRLMQGTNRPWRDAFRAALDGEEGDGVRGGGLRFPDGGGLTLNHPTGSPDDYLEMLDFDPRVLGIEVWNQLTSGFGSDRGFYDSMTRPPSHFLQLWDEILATGRRCWGFFVKDHNTHGRGRNILLVPPLGGLSADQRDAALLRAYRNGTFFGSVAAIASDGEGKVVAPYDRSEFRFRHIRLRRNEQGRAVAIEAAVTGNAPALRPNLQIRFLTDKGIAAVIDGPAGEFVLPRDPAPAFVRIEAFAYPDTHLGGEPLGPETLRHLGPAEIARLHDRHAEKGPTFFGNPAELRTPIPIVDQIFSQPIRRMPEA